MNILLCGLKRMEHLGITTKLWALKNPHGYAGFRKEEIYC
jgi:hypothetical protein